MLTFISVMTSLISICILYFTTYLAAGYLDANLILLRGPPSGVRASGNWLFFVREFVKTKKFVREFVKTMLFVNREKTKYRS